MQRNSIIDYQRYVDDILIMYNQNSMNIDIVLAEMNKPHKNLQITSEKEYNNCLNFLDIRINIKNHH